MRSASWRRATDSSRGRRSSAPRHRGQRLTSSAFLWTVSGIVRPYTGNGRRFGCPTANFEVHDNVPEGIYVSETFLEERWHDSVLFVGVPAVAGDESRRAETHVFDVEDRDYYGLEVTVRCIELLREVQSFPRGEQALLEQIEQDLAQARRIHRERRR